jgi:hypothetical protein
MPSFLSQSTICCIAGTEGPRRRLSEFFHDGGHEEFTLIYPRYHASQYTKHRSSALDFRRTVGEKRFAADPFSSQTSFSLTLQMMTVCSAAGRRVCELVHAASATADAKLNLPSREMAAIRTSGRAVIRLRGSGETVSEPGLPAQGLPGEGSMIFLQPTTGRVL